MARSMPRMAEAEPLGQVVATVERKLGLALALLLLGIIGILMLGLGQPALTYVAGSEVQISAGIEGAACGSHLEWATDSRGIDAGSRVRIINDSTYWQIPVVIERLGSDGEASVVAESPKLLGGDDWTYTFWRSGEYRIVSADETQRLAGLELVVTVK